MIHNELNACRCRKSIPELWIWRVVIATGVLALLFVAWWLILLATSESSAHVEIHKLFLGGMKVILVGVGVTLVGILIPKILTDARYQFRRLKESRIAYSDAKTGVSYLPLRLCSMRLREAAALIQHVHVRKHLAELYDELRQHLRNKGLSDPREWADELYDRLAAMRRVLEANASSWDSMKPAARLKAIRRVLEDRKEEVL